MTLETIGILTLRNRESAGQDWFGVSKLPKSDLEHPSEAIIMSAFRGIIELSQIAEEMLFKVFSTKMIKKPRRDLVLCRSSRLEEISVRLGRWHNNLPSSLTWNQWNPYTGVLMPHLYILQFVIPDPHSSESSLTLRFTAAFSTTAF
jgi:hypothetical protein